ncbi:MAG TPA: small ribosomal subunit Rsm22 family protein [Myxococcales bacterium]|nr:small ribosomal subunit Rsm22 family protein [Myxococcales bacterium]
MKELDSWIPRLLRVFRRGQGRARANRLEPGELAQVAAGVRRLSEGLTRERELVGEGYLNRPDLLGAYLLFYWPVSYAQIRSILPELPGCPAKILDLGGAAGPAAFACLDAGAVEATIADRSAPALETARWLSKEAGKAIATQRWTGGGPPGSGYDLIVAQHLLNELWRDSSERTAKRAALAHALLARLRPGGTLLLVDPALRETSRELLELRDRLVADGVAVRAPCLFRGDCPALLRPTDWCHAERLWEAPPLVAELARAAGLHKEALKMSYLALAPPGEGWPEPPPGRVFRIVSEPLAGKGRRRYMGCGPEGRMGLALQDKHVNDRNRLFLELARGDVVRVTDGQAKGDGVGLGADSSVERLARAGEPLGRG